MLGFLSRLGIAVMDDVALMKHLRATQRPSEN